MTRKRTIGTRAALGGLTAVAALIAAQPAAKADELSDLKANQELLQRRIDQLAQQNVGAGGSYLAPSEGGPVSVQMTGGSFPRSFLIPGTDTSIRIGGEARVNFLYWFNGGNPNGVHQTNAGATGQTAAIPLNNTTDSRRGHNVSQISPQQSKISFETRTPTAWGEARTFIEFDFATNPTNTNRLYAVSDNISDRMRYAYGTLGPLLGGQANSNFSDPDAGVEAISFSGLVGDPGHSRVPQVRWTQPLAGWGLLGALSISAEQAETDMTFPGSNNVCGFDNGGTCPNTAVFGSLLPNAAGTGLLVPNAGTGATAVPNPLKSPSPDFTAAWYIPQPWGHVDFSLVYRPTLQVYNGQHGAFGINKTYSGYGGHFSGDFKPNWFGWDKDFVTWQAVGGDAIGPYINVASANAGTSLASNYGAVGVTPSNTIVKPVFAYGGNIGYRHVWTPEIRSNIGAGYYREDVNNVGNTICPGVGTQAAKTSTGNGCAINKVLYNALANVFWSPVAFADIGVEYFYGHRQTIGNGTGSENVLLSRFRVRF